MISEKFLPIGTIVKLEESLKPVMIVGYMIGNEEYIYDYCGYEYPLGKVDKNTLYFDKQDIIKVERTGYVDEEVISVIKRIEEYSKKIKKRRKQ